MKRKTKAMYYILSVMVAASIALVGCGKNGNSGKIPENTTPSSVDSTSKTSSKYNELGKYPILKEKAVIKVGIGESPNVDYNKNDLTTLLEEYGNVDLQFELFPAADVKQKLQLMVSSQSELPDVLFGFGLDATTILNFGSKGVFQNLNEYYKNSSYHIKKGIEEMKTTNNIDFYQQVRSSDGNLYGVPKLSVQMGNLYPNRAWINKTWLDAIGKPIPKTTDELYEVLKLFSSSDPNKNGKSDEIPMAGSPKSWRSKPQEFLMNAFIYNDTADRINLKSGKVYAAYNQAEWKDGLTFINKLVSENLLSPLSFTQDDAQFKQMLYGSGVNRVGVIISGAIPYQQNDPLRLEYVSLTPLKGPKGVSYAGYSVPGPDNPVHITKYAKDPEAIFRLLDFMWSEECTMQTRYGTKGTGWLPAESGQKGVLEDSMGIKAKFKEELAWGVKNDQHWPGEYCTYRPSRISDGAVYDPKNPTLENLYTIAASGYSKFKPEEGVYLPRLVYTAAETESISDIKTTINTYVNESIARFATGDMSIKNDWDTYVKELDKIGLSKYLNVVQQANDRLGK